MPNKNNKNTVESTEDVNVTNTNVEETGDVDAVSITPEGIAEVEDTIHFVNEDTEIKENPKNKKKNKKESFKEDQIELLVEETLNGLHGSGRERMISLGEHYAEVQKEVNNRLRESK